MLEKLAYVHRAVIESTRDGHDQALRQAGRHLYDIHQILNDRETRSALATLGAAGIAALTADIDHRSQAGGFPCEPRPTDGCASGALYQDSSSTAREVAEGAYRSSHRLVYGHYPSFAECLSKVREYSHLV